MDYSTFPRQRPAAGAVLVDDDDSRPPGGRPATWCMMWCMKRTNIYLAEGQAEALDRVAEAEGVSRAELIRVLIDRAIGGQPGSDLAADLDLPLGVVRILLGDLQERSLVAIHHPIPPARLPDVQILKEVVDGLRRL